jgi:adenine deaminase
MHDFRADSTRGRSLYHYLHDTTIVGDTSSAVKPGLLYSPKPGSVVDSLGYLYIVKQMGIPVLAGTDFSAVAGFGLHAELATYVAEGLTPLEALQAATLNPAKFLHGTDSLGTVAPGKLADLVLLDSDPLVEITNTTKIRAVVANGRYFDRAALDHLLATTPKIAP